MRNGPVKRVNKQHKTRVLGLTGIALVVLDSIQFTTRIIDHESQVELLMLITLMAWFESTMVN